MYTYVHTRYIYIYAHTVLFAFLIYWLGCYLQPDTLQLFLFLQESTNKNNVEDPCRILSWSLIKATWIDQPREQRIKPQDICPIPIFPVNNGNLVDFAFLLLMDRSLQQFNLSIVKKKNIYLIDIYLTTVFFDPPMCLCPYASWTSFPTWQPNVKKKVARVWWWSLPPTVPTSWIKPWCVPDALIVKSRPGGLPRRGMVGGFGGGWRVGGGSCFQVTKISIFYLKENCRLKSVLGRDMLVC